jgi:hypothetical protein
MRGRPLDVFKLSEVGCPCCMYLKCKIIHRLRIDRVLPCRCFDIAECRHYAGSTDWVRESNPYSGNREEPLMVISARSFLSKIVCSALFAISMISIPSSGRVFAQIQQQPTILQQTKPQTNLPKIRPELIPGPSVLSIIHYCAIVTVLARKLYNCLLLLLLLQVLPCMGSE